ncbi:MAG TPA: sodium-dependent transporter, partial [Vicinamibacteria bacterium]|nr:sodium-dependent transporter [Vicinamibacteria bacterium]
YGGGSFLIPWVVFLFASAITLMIAELALGKTTRRGPAGAIGQLVDKRFNWLGVFVGLVTCFIMFYYSVVTGWCIRYFVATLSTPLFSLNAEEYWNRFTSHPVEPVVFHAVAMLAGCFIIYRGVVRGIERTNRILIPLLFLLLVVATLRAVTLPGASRGLAYLFTPNWSELLNYQVWLAALTQSAWSTGAGWGLVMTYGVYFRKKDTFTLTTFTTAFGDNSASLLAGIAVMCTVFAILPEDQARLALGAGNEGLTFIWLPQLFGSIPGGRFFLPLFFLALSFAAISSLIAMLEMASRMAMDLGLPRAKAVPTVGAVAFVLGLPSAWYMGFFKNQDWVWGIGLMVSGLFIAIAVIKYGASRFRTELVNTAEESWPIGPWFVWVLTILVPLEFVAMVAWWFYQSATQFDPEGWWKLFSESSVGTAVIQIVALALILFLTNAWWVRRLRRTSE